MALQVLNVWPSRRQPQPLQTFLGRGKVRVELDRLAVIGNRPVVVALGLIGEAAAPVGEGIFRVEFECLAQIGDATVIVALVVIGNAAVLVGEGIFRVELERLAGAIGYVLPKQRADHRGLEGAVSGVFGRYTGGRASSPRSCSRRPWAIRTFFPPASRYCG